MPVAASRLPTTHPKDPPADDPSPAEPSASLHPETNHPHEGATMSITTTTHLNFRGDARAALEFYQAVFGGEITLVTYQDAHNVQDPSEATQIMWGQVQGDNGIHVMAYDVPVRMPYEQGVNSVFVSVRGKNTEEITSYWKGLSEGASVVYGLAPANWSPLYGMLKDRFGVVWVLDVIAHSAAP
jgi:PhnB protein